MTKKELIEQLEQYPDDAVMCVGCYEAFAHSDQIVYHPDDNTILIY